MAAFERAGVEVRVVTAGSLRAYFAAQAEAFRPDAILASTDDPAQLLLEAALRVRARARGLPGARHAGAALRPRLRLSERSQDRAHTRRRRGGGGEPSTWPITSASTRASTPCTCPSRCWSAGDWPELGRFDNEFVDHGEPVRGERHRHLSGAGGRLSRDGLRGRAHVGHQPARPRRAGAAAQRRAARRRWTISTRCWPARACCWCRRCGPRRARASWWKPCCAACR